LAIMDCVFGHGVSFLVSKDIAAGIP